MLFNTGIPPEINDTEEAFEHETISEPECNSDCECKKGFMCIHHQCKSRECKLDADCHQYG